jgi:hypothetical protein
MSFAASPERNRVVFVARDQNTRAGLWVASLDGRGAPRKLADDVGRVFTVLDREILVTSLDGTQPRASAIGIDGSRPRKLLGVPVVNLRAVSPDGRWLAVEDNITRTVLYRLSNDRMPPIPLCAGCFISWVAKGRYLQVRFGGLSDAEHRRTYLVPIPTGEMLPARFREGRVASEEEVAKLPDVRTIAQGHLSFVPDLGTYVYAKTTAHRNLFRIPLQ